MKKGHERALQTVKQRAEKFKITSGLAWPSSSFEPQCRQPKMEALALISWSHGKESVVNVVTLVSPTKKKTTVTKRSILQGGAVRLFKPAALPA